MLKYLFKLRCVLINVVLILSYTASFTQTKIGDNPTVINPNSILELESTNQGLLMPRVALDSTANAAPLTAHIAGMTVYNTATVKNVTPGYYYNDGTKWVRALTSGLGNLNTPTVIGTGPENTLSITGLSQGNSNTDEVITIDPVTGQLKKISLSMLVKEEQMVYMATNGQIQFNTPMEITDINKINVYRNGIRIGVTAIDAITIQLEPDAIPVAGDEIRIVQIR
ncbi:MAG: hypothetical protein RIR48_2768 [Bacteroidota bacterium]